MPGRLTRPSGTRPPRPSPGPRLTLALVVGVFAAAGVAAGALWEWAWSPPRGLVTSAGWVLDRQGAAGEFAGTGSYLVIAALTGAALGACAAGLSAGRELLVLAAVVLGSALAGWLMVLVGHQLGPPDPRVEAESAAELAVLPDDLRVHAPGAYAAFPAGALTSLTWVYLGAGPPIRRTPVGRVPSG